MIKTYSRPAKFAELKGYCPFAKDDDYIEITEWWNGEGFDVSISEEKTISLTWGEWELIQKMVEYQANGNTKEYDRGYEVGYKIAMQDILEKRESKHSDKWSDGPISTGGMDPRDDLSKCPRCGGPADNGHSREYPPSAYWCTKCEVEVFTTPGG